MEKFSNEGTEAERGKLIVTRNKNTNEIMQVALDENELSED